MRERFETLLSGDVAGVAFFGHGAPDRLYGADRSPGASGPAAIDSSNIGLLRNRWLHAFACSAGEELAAIACAAGVAIFVGYDRPLDVGWEPPLAAEPEFVRLATCTTFSLMRGERDETALRLGASRAADAFVAALLSLADDDQPAGSMWLHAFAEELVQNMVVAVPSSSFLAEDVAR